MLDSQQCVTMACLLDVLAPKPGNVHRGADFEDMTFMDFAASAVAIGPSIADANKQRLGKTILDAIQATRNVVSTNTNLGIVLCLAPLSSVRDAADRPAALGKLFDSLTSEDSKDVFNAIRLAKPGGLGEVAEMDVNAKPEAPDLMYAMELSRERDRVAELYVTNFRLLFDFVAPRLYLNCEKRGLIDGIVTTFVETLSTHIDTLILRKCGQKVAQEAADRAKRALDASEQNSHNLLSDLDFWLRSDNNRRNPGTTADIITSGIYLGLLDGKLRLGKDSPHRC